MSQSSNTLSVKTPDQLVNEFFGRVWSPPHDLNAIDELMTEDYTITTAGTVVKGRTEFKDWVASFHKILLDASNESLDIFYSQDQTKVVSRFICSGRNNGMFGLAADNQPVSFSGIAIWEIRDGRLAACWVERSAFELYKKLTTE